MRLPRHQSYKKSGCDRLGLVPSHWAVVPVRSIVLERNDRNEEGRDQNYLSLMANIGVIPYEEKGDVGNKKPDDLSKCKTVFPDDLVINSMNYGIGSYGLSPYRGVCSPVYIVLRVVKGYAQTRFVLRIFEDKEFQALAQSFGNGILAHRSAIGWDDLKGIKVALPPPEEQIVIAAFLDHETAKIDALIAEQQRLIELLKEKRQAVISHAVTKGLNPKAPMKDSGVEWLGEVPAHWEITRIGWECIVGNGCTPARDNPSYWNDGGYPWLNSSKVNLERVINADQFVTDKALRECALPIVKPGSVLMAITGEGKTRGMVTISEIEATINQHVAFIQPRSKKLYPVYLHDWLNANYSRIRHDSADWGSTKAAITCSDVRAYPLPLPRIEEQEAICHFIESKSSLANDLISSSESSISLLQERRSALVSAAVTGKIDVRDWRSEAELADSMPMTAEEAAQYG